MKLFRRRHILNTTALRFGIVAALLILISGASYRFLTHSLSALRHFSPIDMGLLSLSLAELAALAYVCRVVRQAHRTQQAVQDQALSVQEELHKNETRLWAAQQVAGLGYWEYDLITKQIHWSPEMFRLLDLDPALGPLSYDALMARYHPDDLAKLLAARQKGLQDGRPYEFDLRILQSDNTYRWYHGISKPTRAADGTLAHLIGTLMDIHERRCVAEALTCSEARFRAAMEGSLDAILMLEAAHDVHGQIEDFTIVDMNARAEQMLNRPRAQVIGQHLCELLPENRTRGFFEKYVRVVQSGQALEAEYQSDDRWLHHQVVPVGTGIAITTRDITEGRRLTEKYEQQIVLVNEAYVQLEWQRCELAEANRRLEMLATTDGLTGLKNHRAFQEQIQAEVDRSLRYNTPLSFLLLDVDHFKCFNDQFGHPAGDQVLQQVAQVLQSSARTSDIVARYGGEEFVVILPETDVAGAQECGERIRSAIAEHAWEQCAITISVGASTLQANTSVRSLITEADKALYASKAAGRNCVTHYAFLMPLLPLMS